MSTVPRSGSRAIRARLDHPIVDADGHLVEYLPPLEDYIKAIGGSSLSVTFSAAFGRPAPGSLAQRLETRAPLRPWWVVPTRNTLDRATAQLPRLLAERMDELGMDFTVLFWTTTGDVQVTRPGAASGAPVPDPELEQVRARAVNAYRRDLCRDYADRMTPAAIIPMQTPEIAIRELEHAVVELGMRVVAIAAERRPIPAVHRVQPELFPAVSWVDYFGLDSPYDYDPFWKRCAGLKVPVMSHSTGTGNPSKTRDPQLDALIEKQAVVARDPEGRKRALQEIQRYRLDQAYVTSVWGSQSAFAQWPWLKNYRIAGQPGCDHEPINWMWVDK
jgi:hypothetical protein